MNEPYLSHEHEGQEVRLTADNTALFTFVGKTILKRGYENIPINNEALNHVWVKLNSRNGLYFFEEHNPEQYQRMSSFIVENSFPMSLNRRAITSADAEAWLQGVEIQAQTFAQQIPDYLT